jgi:hypothetical protein
MFDHFYHQIFRKTVIAFGTLFNGITIKRDGSGNDPSEVIEVPLAYGPTQKFLARIEQEPDLNKPVQISLPRMSFEFTGITYDNTRKLAATQAFTTSLKSDGKQIRQIYFPVPYNMEFELSVMTLLNDDALQIVEQILPYFQPNFNLTIDLVESIGEKRDVAISLENVSFQDNYDGDYNSRRVLLYTLKFVAKTYLFGPVPDASTDIIKKVSIGLASGEYSTTASRGLIYKEPVATKSYSGNLVANLKTDIADTLMILEVTNASSIPVRSYITIDDETIYVREKDGNKLIVTRGAYKTDIVEHVGGSGVYLISSADNNLIIAGDNFGFSG